MKVILLNFAIDFYGYLVYDKANSIDFKMNRKRFADIYHRADENINI